VTPPSTRFLGGGALTDETFPEWLERMRHANLYRFSAVEASRAVQLSVETVGTLVRDLVQRRVLVSRGVFRRCPACGDGNDEAMLLDGMCRHCGKDLSDVDGVETFGFLGRPPLDLGETRPNPR